MKRVLIGAGIVYLLVVLFVAWTYTKIDPARGFPHYFIQALNPTNWSNAF